MLSDFFEWLQYQWGVEQTEYGRSYSQALLESLNFWGVLEGTHLLSLMLFFGTILFVDLRLMGLSFKRTPISVLSDKVLPLTVIGFIIVLVTGVVLFFSKPEEYWHNLWFRVKMALLLVAIVNVAVFHKMIQKNQAEWDVAPSPPSKAKISGIISITSWILIIACGRFIAYNWLECGKPQPDWVNAAQNCAASTRGAMTIEEGEAFMVPAPAETEEYTPPPAGDIFSQDFDPTADQPGADAGVAEGAAQPEAQ